MLTSPIYKSVPKRDVAVKKYNRIILDRKLRELKSEMIAFQFPRLVKHSRFQNNPVLK